MDRSKEIEQKLIEFNKEMNWSDFDYPKNILIAMLGEVAELFEEFKLKEGQVPNKENIELEVADVYIYLQKFCVSMDIDLLDVVEKKMQINRERFLEKKVK